MTTKNNTNFWKQCVRKVGFLGRVSSPLQQCINNCDRGIFRLKLRFVFGVPGVQAYSLIESCHVTKQGITSFNHQVQKRGQACTSCDFNVINMIKPSDFYSARNARIASAVLAIAIPSVRPSVTRRYCVKTAARSKVQFAPLDSKMCLLL